MNADLRFLGAERLKGPAGSLAGLELCSCDNEKVGTVDGVLIDPPARRIRYLVVKLPDEPTSYLLAADTPIRIDAPNIGWIESPRADLTLEPFDSDEAPPFTADDVLTAMFSRNNGG